MNENKIVIFSGAGISADSGIKTFRGFDGYWANYSFEEVASPSAWEHDPELVLDFYNMRRNEVQNAEPNEAHLAIAELESQYEVVVITQNIDDLHERAGSSNVIHLHGEITKVRSCKNEHPIYDIGYASMTLGDLDSNGDQLRPHVVWFGENIINYEQAREHISDAGKVLVIGTSLSVYPAANLLKKARYHANKVIVTKSIDKKPFGYTLFRSRARNMVPFVVNKWLEGQWV